MAEQLAEIVDSIRNFEPILALLKRKSPVTLDHVCEGAQAFVAACAVRHHHARSCWILCPDVRRQEEVFNGLLNWQIEALFFPEIELPAIKDSLPDPEIVAERLEVLQKVAEGKRASERFWRNVRWTDHSRPIIFFPFVRGASPPAARDLAHDRVTGAAVLVVATS